jgi:hypothetical protein
MNLRETRLQGPVPDIDALLEAVLLELARRHALDRVHGNLGPEAIARKQGGVRFLPAAADPNFRAPELEDGHDAAKAQDVYAVGATASFLLTGADPTSPPRPLHGYGWLDGLVGELTADLDKRPLNGQAALDRFRALRPRPKSRRAPLLLGLLVVAGGALAVLSLPEEEEPEPAPVLEPQAPEVITCKDAKAEGDLMLAAQAWQSCRFATAHTLYENNPEAAVSVLACRTERMAAAAPHLDALKRVEEDLVLGSCHWARGKLDALDFAVSEGCLTTLELCEAEELPLRQAEVKLSEAKLNAALKSPMVTEVRFRNLADPWIWDIVVEGGWTAFFEQLKTLMTSKEQKDVAAATGMIGYFTAVCTAVGNESQTTGWSSRHIVFEDGGQCVERLPTADAREVSRRLDAAKASQDQQELISAVEYLFSRLQDC